MNHHHILPILSLILGSIAVASYPVQMISLPGAPSYPKFNLFSGYLNGSATAKPAPIFYVLAEAIRADPSTAPLVIWFNGGPGGSSLYGFFIENGPYRMSESGDTLTYDEFSGNQYANVLYLESPLGVGFSQNNQHGQTMNDFDTADINVHAIKDFMTRVHPNYAGRYYYLAGESYAGVYIPYLARSLLKERESGRMGERNFKLLNHGMMPSRLKDAVLRSWMEYRKGKPVNQTDLDNIRAANDEISENFLGWGPLGFNLNEHCYTQAVSSQQSTEEYHRPTDKTAIACYGERALEAYMNTADVQAALHVDKDFHGEKCPFRGQYFRESNVLPVYKDIFTLVNGSSFRVLVYSGDSDSVLPAMNGIQSTAQIAANNSLVDQGFDRAWAFYGDFAGMRSGYKNEHVSMDILTVRGAGHMVPMNLPAQAFQIINNFLFTYGSENVDYSAPIRKRGVVEASQSGLFTYNATIILAIIRILLFIVLAGAYSIHRLRRANICLDLNICDVFKRTKSTNLDNHVLDYRRLEDGSLLEITSSMSE